MTILASVTAIFHIKGKVFLSLLYIVFFKKRIIQDVNRARSVLIITHQPVLEVV